MLPRANRVRRPEDFRVTLRRGHRVGGAMTVLQVLQRDEPGPTRFGFVVSKAVGNAVTRNLVRRRLRAAAAELVPAIGRNVDIVVRALPASGEAGWVTLHSEITEGVNMGMVSTGTAPA